MTWSTVGRFDLMMLATLVISFFAMFCWCRRDSFAENQTPRYLISRLLVAGVITLLFVSITITSVFIFILFNITFYLLILHFIYINITFLYKINLQKKT